MSDSTEVQAALDAARAAAEAGDVTTAGARLREAAELQERTLGPQHADLAETLNNLAIVSERQGHIADAERCYRRAADIAAVALPASHPFVTTSRDNLRAFCEANGLPVNVPVPAATTQPPPAAAPTPKPAASAPPKKPVAHARPTPTVPPPAVPSESSNTRGLLLGFGLLAVAVIVLLVMWLRPGPEQDSPGVVEVPAPAPAVEAPPPAEPKAPPPAEPEAAAPTLVVEAPPPPVPAPFPLARPAAPTPNPTPRRSSSAVVEAKLCLSLSRRTAEWRCEEPGATVSARSVVFYTRVRSPQDTTLSHRWYQGDRLRQDVELEIGANRSSGYRTFSQLTVPAGAAGAWRVELRSADGTLLHEVTFVVR